MIKTFSHVSLAILLLAVLTRLLGIIEYPLHDPTEARYAEIPRLIIETGNWIMPPFDYDVPFWGKPPLTFWLTAISFKLFGYSEFAARLPVFLLASIVLWLSYRFAKVILGAEKAAFSSVVLISTALFFIASGAVMTDMALCLCISLSMISFWHALNNPSAQQAKKWSYLFFVGMGLGLLVKGPIVGVLVLLPLIAWVILEKQWLAAWQQIPWFKGSALMLLIAVPWYIIAEIDSPGFINYFLVGEHFKRFVDAGWHGDLYGVAHEHPRGKIWLLWLFASFPWSFIFIGSAVSWPLRKNKTITLKNSCQGNWHSYLLLWAIAPMVFFSLSGNILYTYVLPGLPAFAMMVTEMLCLRFDIKAIMHSKWLYAGFIIPVVGLVFMGLAWTMPEKLKFEKNQKHLVEIFLNTRQADNSQLSYAGRRLFSIDFHTQGHAKRITINVQSIAALTNNSIEDYLIVKKKNIPKLPDSVLENFELITKYRKYALLKEK
ncbi:ArnT family glycosyltransferase [Methyloprofundus sp.]|uniref:ArnT family glycosyltransferase n=1 Tax=Methyloprofundus sp. TaxID=2020875 RepID=UPI003D096EEA